MKYKHFEVVIILFATAIILLLYSIIQPKISFPFLKGEQVNFSFLSVDKILNLGIKETINEKADIVTEKLIAQSNTVVVKQDKPIKKDTLTKPEKPTTFLFVPSSGNVSCFDNFFSALYMESPKEVVHIGHYGDSQIEGDRISSNFRNKFRQEFGGQGVGFVPLTDITDCISYSRTSSENWQRYTVFKNKFKNGFFGLSGMVFKYANSVVQKPDEQIDSTSTEVKEGKIVYYNGKAHITICLNNNYSDFSVMYGNAEKPCQLSVRSLTSSKNLAQITLNSTNNFVKQKIDLTSNDKNISISFSGTSPNIYGLNFDGDKGVQVDNYAIRGHSGDRLIKINPNLLIEELKETNTHLVIFQFGANSIPYVKSDETLEYISQEFTKLFQRFKQSMPNLSILVVGVGDMATRIDGEYTSYPMIPKIRDVMKNAALKSNCAYFDLFEFMGGNDAILSWSKKGLASKDGHFSPAGQEIVANEIFKAIMKEYALFKQKYKINT